MGEGGRSYADPGRQSTPLREMLGEHEDVKVFAEVVGAEVSPTNACRSALTRPSASQSSTRRPSRPAVAGRACPESSRA